ncbi:Dolichyl-phosphate-mannose-protein mannosyltransferase [Anatilimnocola aggregata]|uniref:Dolichyl-phosphate-mannose-protein mannosyltransferase n=1 Tax=Anatilimnocola aggregata TaxID=2528021 RepID=A0A517YCZ2_9BACT|nr:glycosyltransferase family 39 protein [Anatilimnocola aggregata]QDU27992.1 Dolichyl-phosphate-mannose-protein mannosyltransferase [Anatilimnocola aggregata]
MLPGIRTRWVLAAILAVALIVRLGAAFWWQSRVPAGQRFGFPDSESYWQLGQTIAAGQPYEFGPERYRVFRTPGYPLLLSVLFVAGGHDVSVMSGRFLSALLGTLTVALAAALAWQMFDDRTALLTALAVTVYPEAIAQSVFVLSEAPFTPLMIAQLIAWLAAWRASSRRDVVIYSLLAGVAAGVATLMRPSWLLFTPFALGIGIVLTVERVKQLQIGVLMMVGLALTMSPWWYYTYSVAGRFVPTSLQVGASLYDGLSPIATGASDMRFVPEYERLQKQLDAANLPPANQLFEDRLDQRLQRDSVAWITANPQRALQLAGIKFLRIWSPLPNAAEFRSNKLRLVLMISYLPAMILAAIGLWRSRSHGWPVWLLLLPAIYFTSLHMIFVSSIRYRQPAMVPLLILSAVAVSWLITTVRRPPTTSSTSNS